MSTSKLVSKRKKGLNAFARSIKTAFCKIWGKSEAGKDNSAKTAVQKASNRDFVQAHFNIKDLRKVKCARSKLTSSAEVDWFIELKKCQIGKYDLRNCNSYGSGQEHEYLTFVISWSEISNFANGFIGERENFVVEAEFILLAAHSEYFNTLFFGDFEERNKDQFELPEVSASHFNRLLEAIYPSPNPDAIIDNHVECLLRMADRFLVHSVTQRCVEYLKKAARDSSITIAKKLLWAQTYNFHRLNGSLRQRFQVIP
uniref:BTB domain-containing protein n=1 Tax=Ditylenchus dipsaci TaxID=166011 RepID=A0A915DG74_9BILA